ncbi:uncharacterized protein isoform X2 [Rhodnius prolixus]|uniref:uncharacterized protein isoform X2 n=1 Tax=Rhodnius prolixus TaxID=13249 RepID=UPI003D188C85
MHDEVNIQPPKDGINFGSKPGSYKENKTPEITPLTFKEGMLVRSAQDILISWKPRSSM